MEDIIKQIKSDNANGNTDTWIVIPYPSTFGKPIVMVEGLSYAIITENEERSIAAWEFIKWMLTPENQVMFVEKTGTFPLSSEVIEQVDVEAEIYAIWKDSLQYLPYAQAEPSFREWYVIEKVLEDVGWDLIQYTMQAEDIQAILVDAEAMVGEFE
jgi:ABC-type glycerol-3-phosphate transport system substrate-binding protein